MKSFLITSLFLLAIATKAAAQKVIINNTTTCTVTIILIAHDSCSSTSCASYLSRQFTVAGGGHITFNDETAVNLSTCTAPGTGAGWQSGCYPGGACLFLVSPWGWDGAEIMDPPNLTSPIFVSSSTCITASAGDYWRYFNNTQNS